MVQKKFPKTLENNKYPIVYSKYYNVRFLGLERFHNFNAKKWKKTFKRLMELIDIDENETFEPSPVKKQELSLVHTKDYLRSLKWSWNVARILEAPFLSLLPNIIVRRYYLRPMRYQTQGTIMACELALKQGWAINLGGGFHHCSAGKGGGFCIYADISIAIRHLFNSFPQLVKKVMIVDVDAHQGNGYQSDFFGHPHVYIMDVYNQHIYPWDLNARKAIHCKVEVNFFIQDGEYLPKLKKGLETSLSEFQPDILIYNAGTDVLEGDCLGMLYLSPTAVVRRDEFVFRKAREKHIPIVMLTGGGYTNKSVNATADSIANLFRSGIIART
nr:histone deacetylase 11-like [Halyomorpha halys]